MKNKMLNLTLSAAALAALMVIAPKASAEERGRGRGSESPRQQFRAPERNQSQGFRERGWREQFRTWAPPARVYGHRAGWAAPYRAFSGFRFFSYRPGPGYLYIANFGWVLPPFFGAVWVPPHYDIGGFWVEGCWR